MKRVAMLVSLAAAATLAVALPIAALESGEALGSTGNARAAAALPPRLVALERKMRGLHINSERASFDEVERAPGMKGANPLEDLGSGSFRSGKGSTKPTTARKGRGDARTRRRIRTVPLLSGTVEVSSSPALVLAHGRLFGALRFELRDVGGRIYVRESGLAKQDGGRPWEQTSAARLTKDPGKEFTALGDGKGSTFAKLKHELLVASSVVEVGPATVDRRRTIEFAASGSGKRMLSTISSSSKAGAKLRKVFRRAKVTLHVFVEPDGLPVRTSEQIYLGKRVRIDESSTILATEIPVSVEAPPASKTISQAELEKLKSGEIVGIEKADEAEGSVEAEK